MGFWFLLGLRVSGRALGVLQAVDDIKGDVKRIVQDARASGARFTIQGDTWKPKMKRLRITGYGVNARRGDFWGFAQWSFGLLFVFGCLGL